MQARTAITSRPAITVGLVFGGTGPEHEASLASARSVLDHLNPLEYSIRQFGINRNGDWLVGDGAWDELYQQANQALLPAIIRDLPSNGSKEEVIRFRFFPNRSAFSGLDCLLPVVHGVGGEDGTLRGFLDLTLVPVAGCGLLGCVQSYNKWTARRLAGEAGIPTINTIFVSTDEEAERAAQRVRSELGTWDLIVKPAASGSSFGVSRISEPKHLADALTSARRYSRDCLIETFTLHRELFVGIIGEGPNVVVSEPAMSPLARPGFSTYHDKYIADEPPLRCPSGLGVDIDQRAREIALRAYEALGCSGFARVDLFACVATGTLWLNEVNAVPALAADCSFAAGMKKAGYSYPDLLAAIIAQACQQSAGFARHEAVQATLAPNQC